jgi:hypothetical protein
MFDLRLFLMAALAASSCPTVLALESAEQQFTRLAPRLAAGDRTVVDESLLLEVDLGASPGFTVERQGEMVELRYRMAFNQVAEGWSWQPQANPAVDDYYRFKFMPLQSVVVDRGQYVHEDKIGSPQQMQVSWRYDYFLAFENLYDFYPRTVDDDAGFVARLPYEPARDVHLQVRAHLAEPVLSESTTFWKAIHARPIDFTLKKRYLVGVLDEVDFIDGQSGRILCRIRPGHDECGGQ